MHINTKMRLAALLYLMAAYAVALPGLALFTDLVINGGIIDMWKGAYSFMDLLARRKILYVLIMPGQRMMKSEPEAFRLPYIPFAEYPSAAARLPALCQGSI